MIISEVAGGGGSAESCPAEPLTCGICRTPAGVTESFGAGKNYHTLVIRNENSTVNRQKTDFFFPKQAPKRSSSEMSKAVVLKL